jgi:hypothetical protein
LPLIDQSSAAICRRLNFICRYLLLIDLSSGAICRYLPLSIAAICS